MEFLTSESIDEKRSTWRRSMRRRARMGRVARRKSSFCLSEGGRVARAVFEAAKRVSAGPGPFERDSRSRTRWNSRLMGRLRYLLARVESGLKSLTARVTKVKTSRQMEKTALWNEPFATNVDRNVQVARSKAPNKPFDCTSRVWQY
jgi:hypothetical protein